MECCTQYQYWRINNFVWGNWKRCSRRSCRCSSSRRCGCCRCRDWTAIIIWTRTATRASGLTRTIFYIFIICSMTVGHTESIMIAVVEATEIFYFQFILTFQEITIGFKIITSTECAALKGGQTYYMKLFSGSDEWIPRLRIRSDSFPYKDS